MDKSFLLTMNINGLDGQVTAQSLNLVNLTTKLAFIPKATVSLKKILMESSGEGISFVEMPHSIGERQL